MRVGSAKAGKAIPLFMRLPRPDKSGFAMTEQHKIISWVIFDFLILII